ncbi:MAG TPA: Crp/Fnr family transcriptional regulator [Candidatus Limnocylindrales bacterium]|nr:Crp/Fnr family transcriptional regulator [Candidatus Limnocylindrales bacterium]
MTNAIAQRNFNPRTFLTSIGSGRRMMPFQKNHVIFAQGEPSDGLFFIQEGKVQLSVVSEAGKEATLGILGDDDFFGEGGLAGQLVRMSSATAMTDCVLLHVEKKAMMLAMSREPKLSATFVKYLLKRNVRYQDDLIDQLFNSSEKRLARILLLMAHFGKEGVVTEIAVPKLSQETLAEMVGTTRSRVSFFMNKFRKLGFINYDTGHHLRVHSSLLSVVLNDDGGTAIPGAAKLTANGKKALEPPAEPGEPPEKERAHRPPLSKPSRALELNAPK